MFRAFLNIFRDNWQWRRQVWSLALADIRKTVRGTLLGWFWLFAKPLVYVVTLWFVIDIGLRSGHSTDTYPFLLWLSIGLFAWFYMSAMLSTGTDLYHRYPYLVNKLRFPLSVISNFYSLAQLMIYLISMVVLVIVMLLAGVSLSIYFIQLPFIIALMYLFFMFWSIMVSPLSAMSKDFSQLIRTMNTPIFWISGILYNVDALQLTWFKWIQAFNPVYYVVTALRAAICDKYWLWERPDLIIGFGVVLCTTMIIANWVLWRAGRVVPDVI
ncbi:MAG: ABC transporter permease [Coriobacteriales bacterium]|jgi:teichoic acid transport system permease protein|nr:ABC transporter permease [Coriobacteriales bacterium]